MQEGLGSSAGLARRTFVHVAEADESICSSHKHRDAIRSDCPRLSPTDAWQISLKRGIVTRRPIRCQLGQAAVNQQVNEGLAAWEVEMGVASSRPLCRIWSTVEESGGTPAVCSSGGEASDVSRRRTGLLPCSHGSFHP